MAYTDATHSTYDSHKRDWELIQRMLTLEDVEQELTQRYFEHDEHFRQRRKDSRDTEGLTAYLLTRLAGILFQRADDVSRELGPVLTEDDLEDAGPDDEDYSILLLQMAVKLLAYDEAVCILNPASGWRIATPLVRPNWTDEGVIITGHAAVGDRLDADVEQIKTWTVYRPDGYQTYRRGKDREEPDDVLIDEGMWTADEAFFVDQAGTPVPPVLTVSVPWETRLGLIVAKGHRAIFEMTSRRDFALSSAMNGLIQIGVGGDIDLADKIKDDTKGGAKMVPYAKEYGEHKGLEMPTAGIEIGNQVIDGKKEELRRTAYDNLRQAAQQSATEAIIHQQGGAAAALSVMAETMADAEQRMLHLWTQARDFRFAGPDPRPIDVSVTWPTDYSEIFADSDIADRLFGRTLPADTDTKTEVLVRTLEDAGIDVDEERRTQLEAAVQAQDDQRAQAADAGGGFFG